MPSLTYDQDGFTLDGRPLRILSGAMHYFRVLPEQWDARLSLLRAMGLNTVETYVAWNLHEPRPGQYDFSGRLDLAEFVRAADRHGLKVLLRPGPYICAEWEFGGLPAWLLRTRPSGCVARTPASWPPSTAGSTCCCPGSPRCSPKSAVR